MFLSVSPGTSNKLKQKVLCLGLTGGIGTGKTSAAAFLRTLGARVLDCDKVAHEALKKKSSAYPKIVRLFGAKICDRQGRILRRRLASLIFDDPEKRQALEAIVHPFVFQRIQVAKRSMRQGILVIDMPLLFETGFEDKVDKILLIDASVALQIKRASKRLHISEADAKKRNKSQMPIADKRKKADWVICNEGSLKDLQKKLKQLWDKHLFLLLL